MLRQRVSIPFGGGLDRYSGPLVADPRGQEDLRNVHLADGFAHVRLGAAEVSVLDGRLIVAGAPFRVSDEAVLVVYDPVTRDVHIYRAAADGSEPQDLGVWFNLPNTELVEDPPRAFLAEVSGRMFFAHDEPVTELRAPTAYIDTETYTVTPLEADWAHDDGIRFRGVEAHLDAYLVGWGYGAKEELRPDLVRMSLPGEPTTFNVKHYAAIGAGGTPVIRCISTDRTLLAFLTTGHWDHFGTDRASFGAVPADKMDGLLGAHLAVTIGGVCYFWSRRGPRRSDGRGAQDLSLPLGLRAPTPADLVEEGAGSGAFAAFYPQEDEVLFVFGQRVYAFSLRSDRWRYDELPFEPRAGLLLQPAIEERPSLLPGYFQDPHVTADAPAAGDTWDVTVRALARNMFGDEEVEVWLKIDDGAWALVQDEVALDADPSQDFELLELEEVPHTLQLRTYRPGSPRQYRSAYMVADPEAWPVQSRLEFVPGEMLAPAFVSAEWERTSAIEERITVTVTPSRADRDLELLRDDVVVATVSAPHAGDVELVDASMDGEELHSYTVRHALGTIKGTPTAPIEVWAGPPAPSNLVDSNPMNPAWYAYGVEWAAGTSARVQDDYLCSESFQDRGVTATNTWQQFLEKDSELAEEGGEPDWPFTVRVRHEVTTFDVLDHSDWAVVGVSARLAIDETANDSCP